MNRTNTIKESGSVKFSNSFCGENCRAYNNAVIVNSSFGSNVSIGNDTNIVNCSFADNIAINRRCYVNNTSIDSYSYVGLNSVINYATIGKFCSIARGVDIGGFNHDYTKISTMPKFRYKQLSGTDDMVRMDEAEGLCSIGNDVWIAAGAHILHNVKIGDGAVIGAGAVVTGDVEPYTIVFGVPAKFYKKRFEQKYIDKLLEIKWWDLPLNIIENNIDTLLNDTPEQSIEQLTRLAALHKK